MPLPNNMLPEQWLRLNYELFLGNKIVTYRGSGIIVNVKETDNIGHQKTDAPVVISVDYGYDIQWETLESLRIVKQQEV